jgi:hypothetical protein
MKKFLQLLNKPEVIIISLSLLFTTVVSAVVGLGGLLLTTHFWGFFIIAFGIQFIIFAISNTVLQRKDIIEGTMVANQQLEALSKFTVRLVCAYCKQTNDVPVVLNQENRYKCGSCNQVNGVKMQFFSTQVTTPLSKILLPVGDESIDITS